MIGQVRVDIRGELELQGLFGELFERRILRRQDENVLKAGFVVLRLLFGNHFGACSVVGIHAHRLLGCTWIKEQIILGILWERISHVERIIENFRWFVDIFKVRLDDKVPFLMWRRKLYEILPPQRLQSVRVVLKNQRGQNALEIQVVSAGYEDGGLEGV